MLEEEEVREQTGEEILEKVVIQEIVKMCA